MTLACNYSIGAVVWRLCFLLPNHEKDTVALRTTFSGISDTQPCSVLAENKSNKHLIYAVKIYFKRSLVM